MATMLQFPEMDDVADRIPVTPTHARPKRAAVVINASAGDVLEVGKELFAQRIRDSLGAAGYEADVRCVKARALSACLGASLREKPDLTIAAGGDGTISRLLPILLKAEGDVAILPLGTLNLLARDTGLGTDLDANLAAIASSPRAAIDLGTINGQPFHSNAGLGFFAMMAREREVARRRFPFSKTLGFIFAALRTTLFSKTITVEMEVAGHAMTVKTDAVLVTNNRFAGTPWRRERLDEGVLEVHTLQAPGISARLRAAVAVARGTWRDLPSLTSFTTPAVRLSRQGRATTLIALDGELSRHSNPLDIRIKRAALRLPVSASESERGAS